MINMNPENRFYVELLEKLKSYCVYRERCEWEVELKLNSLGASETRIEQIVGELKKQNFLDNKRFAAAFVSGKFRMKKWGKNKIKAELRSKKLDTETIDWALDQIDDEDYIQCLEEILEKKWRLLKSNRDSSTRIKLQRFLYGKGFENDFVNTALKNLFS